MRFVKFALFCEYANYVNMGFAKTAIFLRICDFAKFAYFANIAALRNLRIARLQVVPRRELEFTRWLRAGAG